MSSSFYDNRFLLGHSAMMINEGLPNFIVNKLRHKYELNERKVGILGMAFKAEIDDIRDSLSFKLSKILKFYGAKVYLSDEYYSDPIFYTKEELLSECETIIIGAPHKIYKNLQFSDKTHVIDIWKTS